MSLTTHMTQPPPSSQSQVPTPSGSGKKVRRIVVGCDHRGFDAKLKVVALLRGSKHCTADCPPVDLGCDGPTPPVDYPDVALRLAHEVVQHDGIGILLDKSGVGMCIVANKIKGIRAALAHDEVTARLARAHNHCNVLCMGVDLLTDDQMRKIIETFLTTDFEGGRHEKRVAKVDAIMK